jgi:NADP-dependent 3-hydroxy acid dehydrogenase YdfG
MGIGLAVAHALAERGAQLVLAARGMDELERATAELPGSRHEAISLDVPEDQAWPVPWRRAANVPCTSSSRRPGSSGQWAR